MTAFSALLFFFFSPISALDFPFNSISNITNGTDLILINDAQLDAVAIFLTNYTNMYTFGSVFHPTKIPMNPLLTPDPHPPPRARPTDARGNQFFGLFANAAIPFIGPLLAVEFNTDKNIEFNDPNANHIGIQLNNIKSVVMAPTGYYSSTGGFIEFDKTNFESNIIVALANMLRPSLPTLTYKDPKIVSYVSAEMFVRVLAWSFTDVSVAREIASMNLPVFQLGSSYSSLSNVVLAGIAIGCIGFVLILASRFYLYQRKNTTEVEEIDKIEDWELEFGKVYKGTLSNAAAIAIKCVNHNSTQGVREFMAKIASMGQLLHKNLVQMRGWCRNGNELMLVYNYMPNGSLDGWIFDKPKTVMGWEKRQRVVADVNHMVVHRDIKSSNILLDVEIRGRLGDFLYRHGELPNVTHVVGTLGYLAPEFATGAMPAAASDVYSFGMVLLEVACGRKPIMMKAADSRIQGQYEAKEMETTLKLGLACCHPDPMRRPNMNEVVSVLVGEATASITPAVIYWRGDGSSDDQSMEVKSVSEVAPLVQGACCLQI
ncbi:L-type lectin-domain containing receptor kinase S.1 [Pyrus ussuriensis x Pyrus communis]|uniref:L-type lectin-domain containing receptor kinase S.1 n=1 Tax=Pyrus ussuriensis x Pyrus communis TaxID=2448454 RepID=A0A5N5HXA9_9ROSA|nr:L-type lectin-domain containing receptor kinase S.1 [Pyrus ussuriensis x Pyrus communis]